MDDTSLRGAIARLYCLSFDAQRLGQVKEEQLAELRDIIAILDYHSTPKEGVEPPITTFFGPQPSCQADGCMKSWKDYDACMLNLNGKWLCRDHHPALRDGAIRPPGYHEPATTTAERDKLRQDALVKLSREESRLINTRIGG